MHHVYHVFEILLVDVGEGPDRGRVDVEDAMDRAILAAGNDDLWSGQSITWDVVFQLLSVMGNECAHLACALATLAIAHSDLTAGENVCIADVLPNEDLFIIVSFLVVEAYETELVAEDFA